MNQDGFQIEKRLRALNPQLHKRFTDAVFTLQNQQSGYLRHFPMYTDHSYLHVLTVLEYCNQLIRAQDIDKLNADELYVLLMGTYMHDIGMGILDKDFEDFCQQIDMGDYFDTHDKDDFPRFIRHFHNDFSACYVRKYADLLELPSEEHTFAIAQVARGHRKVDLFDPVEFPQKLELPDGDTICLPYLAAIVRLADELDVTVHRNPMMLFDYSDLSWINDDNQVFEYRKHQAVRDLTITPESVDMYLVAEDMEVHNSIVKLAGKIQDTLDYCSAVIHQITPYEITQKQVIIHECPWVPVAK